MAATDVVRDVRSGDTTESWGIAVEMPVEITLNGIPWTVLLATPHELDDLAIGLACTEGVLRDPSGVESIDIATFLHDVRVDLRIAPWAVDETAVRARTLVSGTACGLCGIESLAQLQSRRPPNVVAHWTERERPDQVADAAIDAAFAALPALQPVNQRTRSMHAAAWCDTDGSIRLVREDVGRHNALDKLVGALARTERLHAPGFVAMTSRCSYELVAKTAITGARLLATVSAPTSLALAWAAALDLPLATTRRRGDATDVIRFSPPSTRGGAHAE